MEEFKFSQLNLAGWGWKNTKEEWKSRLFRGCNYLKEHYSDALAIALHETQLTAGKRLETIRDVFPEKDWEIILPNGFDPEERPKSVACVLLLNKAYVNAYSIMKLGHGLEDHSNYNYVAVTTNTGRNIELLSVHVPHNCFDGSNAATWYIETRRDLRKRFEEAIFEVAEGSDNLVLMTDLNAGPEDSFVKELAYRRVDPIMFDAMAPELKTTPTWERDGKATKIDYLLYSYQMMINGAVAIPTTIDRSSIDEVFSDHVILTGGIKFK